VRSLVSLSRSVSRHDYNISRSLASIPSKTLRSQIRSFTTSARGAKQGATSTPKFVIPKEGLLLFSDSGKRWIFMIYGFCVMVNAIVWINYVITAWEMKQYREKR
jgi:hypothetical protein